MTTANDNLRSVNALLVTSESSLIWSANFVSSSVPFGWCTRLRIKAFSQQTNRALILSLVSVIYRQPKPDLVRIQLELIELSHRWNIHVSKTHTSECRTRVLCSKTLIRTTPLTKQLAQTICFNYLQWKNYIYNSLK